MDNLLRVSESRIKEKYGLKITTLVRHERNKLSCYLNQNVCFDLDFVAQKNDFLRTGIAKNSLKFKLQQNCG